MRFHDFLPQRMRKSSLFTCILGLVVFALASSFNVAIAFSFLVTYAAFIIKLCKLQTEPFLLLTIHCLTSSMMLLDAPTTLALIVAVFAAAMTFDSCEVATERVAVFLISLTFSTTMGTITAILASVAMAIVLTVMKLRPLRLAVICMLGLHLLGVLVIVDGVLASFVALTLIGLIIIAFLLGVLTTGRDVSFIMNHNNDVEHRFVSNNNNNNNNTISTTPTHMHNDNGCLQLSNPTDSLDLQDHTVTSALQALHQFLSSHEEVYKRNRTGHIRHVKVITGEGGFNTSQEMVNLIKPTVANYLKLNKYKFDVSRENPGILIIDLESHAL